MFIRIQEPVVKTWKRVFYNILNTFWTKLYQPYPAIEVLHLSHKNSIGLSESIKTMPRRSTRRRHHSPATSTGGYKEKRRRVDSDDVSLVSVKSPSRKRNDVKRRRHDSEEIEKDSNASSYERSSHRRRERSKRSHHRKSPTSGRRAHKYRFRHDESEDSSTRRRHRDRAKEKDNRIASPVKNRISTYDFPLYCENERNLKPHIVSHLPSLQNQQQLNSEKLNSKTNNQNINEKENNQTTTTNINLNSKLRISSGVGGNGGQQQLLKYPSNDNNNLILNKNINNNNSPLQLDTKLTTFNDTNQYFNHKCIKNEFHKPRMPSPTPSLSLSSEESSSPPSSPSYNNISRNRQLTKPQFNKKQPLDLKLSISSSAIQILPTTSSATVDLPSTSSGLSRLFNSENLSPKSTSSFISHKSSKPINDYNNNNNKSVNLKENSSILPVKPPDMMEIEKLLQQNRLPHNQTTFSSSLPIPSLSSTSTLCTTNNNNINNISSSTGNESDLYTAEIDYMNNYLKSLPDYRELDKNIHKEFQKCEDLYDQIQSINSGLIQQQQEQQKQNPLSKSSSHQSILKTTNNKTQFPPIKIQNEQQQQQHQQNKNWQSENWKEIFKAAEPVNTQQSITKSSFPSIFAQFCNKSTNGSNSKLSRSLSSTNMPTTSNYPIDYPEITGFIPKSNLQQQPQQQIPSSSSSIPMKSSNPILIKKSSSNSCIFRPNGNKQSLNDFWSEKKHENTTKKQSTKWNYDKIVSNNNQQQPNLSSSPINDNNNKQFFSSSIEGHGAFVKIPPKTKIPLSTIDNNNNKNSSNYNHNQQYQPNKLQKNLSLSQLDNKIRQNVSKEELYKLICNDPIEQKYNNNHHQRQEQYNQNDDNKIKQIQQTNNIVIQNIPGFMNLNKSVSLSNVPAVGGGGLMKSNSKSQIPCYVKQMPILSKSNSTVLIPLHHQQQQQNCQQNSLTQIENVYPSNHNYQQPSVTTTNTVQPPQLQNCNRGVQKSSSSSCIFGNKRNQYQPLGPREIDSKIWSAQSFAISKNNLNNSLPVVYPSIPPYGSKQCNPDIGGIKPNIHQNYQPYNQSTNYQYPPVQANNIQQNNSGQKFDNLLPLTKVSSAINIPIGGIKTTNEKSNTNYATNNNQQQSIKNHRQVPPPPPLQVSSVLDKSQKLCKISQNQQPVTQSPGDLDIIKRQKDTENMLKINLNQNPLNQQASQQQPQVIHKTSIGGFKSFPLGKSNSTSSVQHSVKQTITPQSPPQIRSFKKPLPNWSSFVDCSKNFKKLAPSTASSTLLYQINNNNTNQNSSLSTSTSSNPGKFIQHGQQLRQQQSVNNTTTGMQQQQSYSLQQQQRNNNNNPNVNNKNEIDKNKNINKENILKKYIPNTYVAPIINQSSLNNNNTTNINSGNTTNSIIYSANAVAGTNSSIVIPQQSVTTLLQNSISGGGGNSKKNPIYVGKTGNTISTIAPTPSSSTNIGNVSGNIRISNQSSANNSGNINKNLNNNTNIGSGYNDDKFRSDILSSFDPYFYQQQQQYHHQNDQSIPQQYNSINIPNSTNKLTKNILPSIDLSHLSSGNFTNASNNLHQQQQQQQQPPPPQRLFKTQSASYLVGGGNSNNYNQPIPMILPVTPTSKQQNVYQNLPQLQSIHHPPSTSSACYNNNNYVDQMSSSSVSNCSNNNNNAEVYYEVEKKNYILNMLFCVFGYEVFFYYN